MFFNTWINGQSMIINNMFKLSLISSALLLTACGGSDDKDTPVEVINQAPVVSITQTQGNENQTIEISSTATDADGSISSYDWQVTSEHSLTLIGSTTESISFIAPAVSESGDTVSLKLIVTDNEGAASEATSSIGITNVVPTVAVDNVSVDEKSSVALTAIMTSSVDDIASYLWEKTSGPEVSLEGSDTVKVTFTAPEISENTEIGIMLTVTDADGDVVTTEALVNVNQLTIPLKISGLATDSPISNGMISVQVAGRDITVDVTADENGLYNVDLLLDDSEVDAFVSIVAKGVAEQENAGLISLLGTVGHLSNLAGEDNTLTADEGFSVNVTNITTAQYALAKLANNGEEITTNSKLEELSQSLNYEEVIALATAIKVAIDKAGDNASLALPDGVTDTLALVENMALAQEYVQVVQNEPEYAEAQAEIFEDENLIDTKSEFSVPDVYYFLPQATLYNGFTFRFEANEGDKGDNHFTWIEESGVIKATVTDPEISTSFEYKEGFDHQVKSEYSNVSYELKRLSSGEKSDVIHLTTVSKTHYPNGELADEYNTSSTTHTAVKESGVIANSHQGAGIAYLSFAGNDDNENLRIRADEFVLNADGTGHASVMGLDFTWQMNNGALELNIPADNASDVWTAKWKQLTNRSGANQFAHEFVENGNINTTDDYVGESAILASQLSWGDNIAGIYTYDNSSFSDPMEHFWFELGANGDAVTKSSGDWNQDGVLTEDEIGSMYGKWSVKSDGTLVITRMRLSDGSGYSPECLNSSADCTLWHERTWRLIGQSDNQYNLFHKHDFKYSNFEWGEDYIAYDNRTVYKVDSAPVTPSTVNKQAVNMRLKANIGKKYKQLEPEVK
jgi:hypothetical protein